MIGSFLSTGLVLFDPSLDGVVNVESPPLRPLAIGTSRTAAEGLLSVIDHDRAEVPATKPSLPLEIRVRETMILATPSISVVPGMAIPVNGSAF